MQKIIYPFLFIVFICVSCSESERETVSVSSDSDIDAARNFLQAALAGDFNRAKNFMIADSLNLETLNTIQRWNERQSKEERDNYQSASIRIHNNRKLNDSVSVISYSNSYKNKVDSLKLLKSGDEWLVDFKFILQKTDTLP